MRKEGSIRPENPAMMNEIGRSRKARWVVSDDRTPSGDGASAAALDAGGGKRIRPKSLKYRKWQHLILGWCGKRLPSAWDGEETGWQHYILRPTSTSLRVRTLVRSRGENLHGDGKRPGHSAAAGVR